MDLTGKRVFLSGPMTGQEHNNVSLFAAAYAIVKKELGASFVYSPAQAWLNERNEISEEKTHDMYMLDCIHELTRRDYTGRPYYALLVSLPDWHRSDGAAHERDVAEHCGIPCIDLQDLIVDGVL